MTKAMFRSEVTGYPRREGKVRDVYDLGDRLIIVASDRVSAFDWVLPTPIPDKGRILTTLTLFWLKWLNVPNHLLSSDSADFPPAFQGPEFAGRTMLVRKTKVFPFECVVRGYLAGSGWKDYRRTGAVCGIPLPKDLRECDALPQPLFTPATKAEEGHDENVSFERMQADLGPVAVQLQQLSCDVYHRAAEYARQRGVIIADTKFEWGALPNGAIILIDEVLTPDSSRFWPADRYQPGQGQPSFDKQFIRDWLETTPWDKQSPPPALPEDVVRHSQSKYREALERLTGQTLPTV